MARIKQEINPKSSKNLKYLCSELHITQKQLSAATGISENTLSKIATGRGPLTRQIAGEIIKAFPSYRIEWLLGFDDSPHKYISVKLCGVEAAVKCLAAIDLLSASGVEVGQVNSAGVFFPASKGMGFVLGNQCVEIRRGNNVIWSGSIQTIEHVLLEICEFSLFKIGLLQKEWGDRSG